jgi:hypothetical protein
MINYKNISRITYISITGEKNNKKYGLELEQSAPNI